MTGKRCLAAIGGVLLLGAAGLAQAQPQSGIVRPTSEPARPSVQLGGELYAGNCATCHGIDGAGITVPRSGAGGVLGAGPPLRGVERLAAFLAATGANYFGGCFAWGNLSGDQVLRSLHLFTEHCAGCHQVVARGGYVPGARVPPLQGVNATEIAEAVRVGPYLMPRFSTRQITDAQLGSIIKYVLSTRRPNNRGGWGIGNIGPIPEGLVTWWIAAPLLVAACMALGRRFGR